ncbi:hypothetical protein ACFP2T_11850 [Plantactinospora solaniradicis]|uniref:DUF1877 family protein n=1 Tax=Plantactinospora solaniradicis TaxID=1723736 RepID=A0ABW1K6K0_9ACTN
MSSIIEFFVAPDDAVATSVAKDGPGPDLKPATYGNFDVWSTLAEWESILLDRDLDEVIDAGGPDVLSDGDGPLVLLVPPPLTKALAQLRDDTLANVVERWIALRAEDDEEIEDELAHDLIGELAALSADAERTRGALYCWIC